MNHSQKWLISQASGVKIRVQIYYVSNSLHLIMYSCSIITFYITHWCFDQMTLIQDQGKHCIWKRTMRYSEMKIMYKAFLKTIYAKFAILPFRRWLYLPFNSHPASDRNSLRVDSQCLWLEWLADLFLSLSF